MAELRILSTIQIKKILVEHKKWLDSKEEGKQADLSSCDLHKVNFCDVKLVTPTGHTQGPVDLRKANIQGSDLSNAVLVGANFRGANFRGATLIQADLKNANLSEANFVNANLFNANLKEAKLEGANLRDANLQNANLEDTGIAAKLLGATNLLNTDLPKNIPDFDDGLKNVEEASKNARKLFVSMLLGCLYFWLTIGTTKDIDLLLDSSSSVLPVLGATIPTTAFYLVAPLLLLGFFIYFHLYLQRLWDGLSSLPAIFQDGKRLDEKAYPWLLNGFVFSHFEQLKPDRPRFSFLQTIFSVALAWVIVPITIFGFWWRYLSRHYWPTYFHIAFLSLSIWSGIVFYQNAVATLKGRKKVSFSWKTGKSYWRVCKHFFLFAIISSSFGLFSYKAMEGLFKPYLVMNLQKANLKEKALLNINLSRADFKEANLSKTNLSRAYLREANLSRADLKEADLSGANLSRAILNEANLSMTNLSKAILNEANLSWANLSEAILREANLSGANLNMANLSRANLSRANLSRANLSVANLGEANLRKANLFLADLRGANLGGALLGGATFKNTKTNLTVEELKKRGAIVIEEDKK